jgi:dolichol-phosphate mannosyltransferase
MPDQATTTYPAPDIAVLAPAHNEEDNVAPLVEQIASAMRAAGLTHETIIVDDGSTDDTRARLVALQADHPELRIVVMTQTPPSSGGGQSAAFYAGFRAVRALLVATLDADLQNDPADLPALVEKMRETGADMVQGDRSHARADNWMRKQTSRVGRFFRRALLGDTIRDTGCSLRVMRTELALRLPLEFKGMHRFIPVTARHLGYTVVETPVNHRERTAGETKYGSAGITKRAIPGLVDCFAVRYMRARRRPVASEELTP